MGRPPKGRLRARGTTPTPVLVAIGLPLLLAIGVAVLAVTTRSGGLDAAPPPDTRPLALPPVDAPDAGGPDCTALLAALPSALDGPDGPLPPRTLAPPVPHGVRAWAAAPRPAVLRCGLPRPPELMPTSSLLQVNGVQWLRLDDGVPNPAVVSYIAVDRPVYVAVTLPTGIGTGPLQQLSDVLGATVRAAPIEVR